MEAMHRISYFQVLNAGIERTKKEPLSRGSFSEQHGVQNVALTPNVNQRGGPMLGTAEVLTVLP